ncbi:hypothetical protein OG943_15605 [Amycolatopsis sp. NBC_00345]|uniref:hypothetical protein n=1 Tax=Amycolatopsis sp. NBC_00345 TaxID=2975955 RepID=UPI002E2697B9
MSLTDPTLPASSVSDPSSPDYNPHSPMYDATADPSSKYYVGPIKPDDVLSGDQIRADATEQIDQEIKDGWLGPVVDPKVRDQKIQEEYEHRLDEAKHSLGDGLEIRQTGGAPHTVWSNASHEQMQQAISQDADSATVAASSEEWVSVGNDLAGHQQNLAQAINASTANWSGGGGDAAREHLANVGKWLGVTAQGATLSGRQQEIHSQTLNETQKAMAANPPVQFSVQESNARLQQIKDPVVYAEQAGQAMSTYREQQAAREQAAQTMTRFDQTIGSAVVTPQFPAPPKLAGSAGGGAGSPGRPASPLLSPRGPGLPANGPGNGPGGAGPGGENNPAFTTQNGPSGSGPGGPIPGDPGGGGNSPGGGPGGGSGGGPGGTNPGGSGPGGGGNPPVNLPPGGVPGGTSGDPGDGTHIQGYNPPPVNLPPGGGPGSVPGGGIPAIPGGGNPGGGTGPGYTPPSFTPPGINPGANLGPGGGSGPGGTGGKIPTIGRGGGVNGESISSRLGGGSGGGSGSLGGGTGGSGGKGSGLGGPGSSTGAGSGSAAGEETAGRGAAGGAGGKGAAGSPGMGGMGAGAKGGKGPEDKEHKVADFVESDDPSFFSPDEVVAPPVIGDWKNTDWK